MKNSNRPLLLGLAFVGISFASLAFTWPWEVQKTSSEEKPKQPAQAEAGPGFVEEETGEVEWKLQKNDEIKGEATQGTVPAVTAKAVSVYKPAFKPVTPLPPRVYNTNSVPPAVKYTKIAQAAQPPIDISILNLQKQISDIIKLNESIKASQQTQVGEVQRIIEQARIHQRILTELKEGEGKEEVKSSDAEVLLKQEKVRLIQNETEKNKEFIEEIEKALESDKVQGTEPQEIESQDISPDQKPPSDYEDQPREDER